jgi:hypothetical protein
VFVAHVGRGASPDSIRHLFCLVAIGLIQLHEQIDAVMPA